MVSFVPRFICIVRVKMKLGSLHLHMSGNGEQPHVDLFVVLQRILSTHLRDDGQDTRHISIVCPKNNHTVTVQKRDKNHPDSGNVKVSLNL